MRIMCGMTTTYVYEDAEGNRQLVTAEGFDVNSEGILFWAQKNPGIRSRQNIRFVAFTGMFRPNVVVDKVEKPAQAKPAPGRIQGVPEAVARPVIELRDAAVEACRAFNDHDASHNIIWKSVRDLEDHIARTDFIEIWADVLESDEDDD